MCCIRNRKKGTTPCPLERITGSEFYLKSVLPVKLLDDSRIFPRLSWRVWSGARGLTFFEVALQR
jgi:hypothetical protein